VPLSPVEPPTGEVSERPIDTFERPVWERHHHLRLGWRASASARDPDSRSAAGLSDLLFSRDGGVEADTSLAALALEVQAWTSTEW